MKRGIGLIIFLLTGGILFGHPPTEVGVSFDVKTSMVTINIKHPLQASKVSDPARHFIKAVSVTLNGKEVIVENISSQQSDEGEVSSFLLRAIAGDKISVKATCNIAGTKTTELIVK